MEIRVEFAGYLSELVGSATDRRMNLEVPVGITVEELLQLLARQFPAFGEVALHQGRPTGDFQVVVGGLLLGLAGGWQHPLAEDDEVILLPPFAGG